MAARPDGLKCFQSIEPLTSPASASGLMEAECESKIDDFRGKQRRRVRLSTRSLSVGPAAHATGTPRSLPRTRLKGLVETHRGHVQVTPLTETYPPFELKILMPTEVAIAF